MRYTIIIALLMAMQTPLLATAQQPEAGASNKIQAILDSLLYSKEYGFVSNKSVIGAAVGVYWKGKTYYRCYGLADKERQIKTDTSTLFAFIGWRLSATGFLVSTIVMLNMEILYLNFVYYRKLSQEGLEPPDDQS